MYSAMAIARGGRFASRAKFRRFVSIDRAFELDSRDAVARRTSRPSVVAGREEPGRLPLNAVSTVICWLIGRDDPGAAKPVSGRPVDETGRTLWSGPPPCRDNDGLLTEVPGRGMAAVALSSRRSSATPSSSSSVSSKYAWLVRAFVFNSSAALSRLFSSNRASQPAKHSSNRRLRWRDNASHSGSTAETMCFSSSASLSPAPPPSRLLDWSLNISFANNCNNLVGEQMALSTR